MRSELNGEKPCEGLDYADSENTKRVVENLELVCLIPPSRLSPFGQMHHEHERVNRANGGIESEHNVVAAGHKRWRPSAEIANYHTLSIGSLPEILNGTQKPAAEHSSCGALRDLACSSVRE
jgi:hypothetical protein